MINVHVFLNLLNFPLYILLKVFLEKQVYGTEDPYHKKVEVESRALKNIMGIEKKWQIIKIVS